MQQIPLSYQFRVFLAPTFSSVVVQPLPQMNPRWCFLKRNRIVNPTRMSLKGLTLILGLYKHLYLQNKRLVNNSSIVFGLKWDGIVPFISSHIFNPQKNSNWAKSHFVSPQGKLVRRMNQYSKILSSMNLISWLEIRSQIMIWIGFIFNPSLRGRMWSFQNSYLVCRLPGCTSTNFVVLPSSLL